MKFTTKSVDAIKPNLKQQEIPDAAMPGLYLRVMPSGVKSWTLRYRSDGFHRRYTIGKYPKVSLAEARKMAGEMTVAIERGHDPQADKASRYTVLPKNLKDAVKVYIDAYAKVRTVRWEDTLRMFERHVFPEWGNRPIDTIKRRDVVRLIEKVHQQAPIRSNRVLAAVRHFFNWCVSRDALDYSPVMGVKALAKENKRERFLDDGELALLLPVLCSLNSRFAEAFKLLLYTGTRRSEVFGMSWDEIDFDKAVWIIPRERTKKQNLPHLVPLSAPALSILRSLWAERTSNLVFPSTNGSGRPMSGISKAKKALDAAIVAALLEANGGTGDVHPLKPWRIHDIRRTVATGLQRLGARLEVTEGVLHHISGSRGGIAGVYQQHDWADEKRAVLSLWEAHLDLLLKQGEQKLYGGLGNANLTH